MQKKRLDQYRGRLTPQQIAEGMNAALNNAKRLLADAELLMQESRYPSATALAILAIEEAGKNAILRRMATASNDEDIKGAWRDYRSHKEKNVAFIVPHLAAQGARHIDGFKPAFDPDSQHPVLVDMLKQISIYTDCLGNAHWSVPETVADQELAELFVRAARFLVPQDDIHVHTAREVELWIEHMGPVMDKPLGWMKTALLNWHEAMRKEGLTDANPDAVERFVRGPGSIIKKG